MSDRRRWYNAEVEKLVSLVGENYTFLFDSVNNKRTRKDIDEKWVSIQQEVNSLGCGKAPLSVEQVITKWRDLKSLSRSTKLKYDKEAGKTGGGQNSAKKPTELQYKILSYVGPIATEGIAGAEQLDSSRPRQSPSSSSVVLVANVTSDII